MELNKNFIEWACSLSGCEGGNLKADYWVCGIEWGYNNKAGNQNEYYKVELPKEIANGRYNPLKKYPWNDSLTYPYGRNVAKLYSAIIGDEVRNYKKIVENCNGSEIFRMNLYPIAFNNTNDQLWKEYDLEGITGFEEKCLFKTWCFLNRFPAISRLVSQDYHPKVIIGTGISYLTDFFACFASNIGINATIKSGKVRDDSITRSFYWAKLTERTILAVIPFFSGQYGLNSDALIQETGSRIRELIA